MGSSTAVETGVILAAGRGGRLAAVAADRPKILLPVANVPLLSRQLVMLADSGIKRVFLVVGSREFEDNIAAMVPAGLELTLLIDENPQGIAHSLGVVKDINGECFLLLLGDIFLHEPELRGHMVSFPGSDYDAVVFARRDPSAEAVSRSFAVIADTDGRVERVIEKPTRHVSDLRGCGIYLFRESVFNAIENTPKSSVRNEHELTDSIQIMIDRGLKVVSRTPGRWDLNINTPEDLLLCNLYMADAFGGSIIDAGAQIDEAAEVSRSVIGPRARIAGGAKVRNSLVTDGARIAPGESVEYELLFGDHRYRCSPESL